MDVIAAEFGEGKSLYDVLDVPPTATPAVIKKAYFKLALKCVSPFQTQRRSFVVPPLLLRTSHYYFVRSLSNS